MSERELLVPKSRYVTYRYSAEQLRKGERFRSLDLFHVRESGGSLVCGEGTYVAYDLDVTPTKIFATERETYALSERKVYLLGAGESRTGFNELNRIVDYSDELGNVTIALAADRIYRIKPVAAAIVDAYIGGSCIAFFHERMFLGSGTRLYYSPALYYDAINDERTQYAGHIDLPPDGNGDILELVQLRGRLFLMRQRGITALTAYADPLNFRLENYAYECGSMYPESVANCGEWAYFFTDKGLCRFNGVSAPEVVEGADIGRIDFTRPVQGVASDNRYYASVYAFGMRCVYVYDGVTKRGRYLSIPNVSIASDGKETYALCEHYVYRLSGAALPRYQGECYVQFEADFSEANDCYLEGITLEGEGEYRVEATGAERSVTARGSGRIKLPAAIRGNRFLVRILPTGRHFRLDGISLHVRKEGVWTSTLST